MINIENVAQYSQNLNLLYVEDNQEAMESTLIIFEEFFKNIFTAHNGQEGFDKFEISKKEGTKIDLIITDINMPKLNGLQMIDKIKELDADIPILVLSAYNESGYFVDSIKLGIEGYLLKPIDIDQFLGVLEKVVQKLKLSQEVKKTTNLLNQYKQITDKSAIISVIDTNEIITYVNDAFCNISQYSQEELLGVNYHSILAYRQPQEINDDIWSTISIKKDIWQGTVKFVSRYGHVYYLKTTIKPILDEDNNIIEYIALRDDVTQIMNPNKQLLDSIKTTTEPCLVYMKIEDFDTFEEFYDHRTIEQIQDKIAVYLKENLPKKLEFDKVYQLGNGEFAMVRDKSLSTYANDQEFISDLEQYHSRLKNITFDDIVNDISLMISLSYGSNHVLENVKLGIKQLLKSNDDFIIANHLVYYEREKAIKNMETISMIKTAIQKDNIVSYFQPIVDNHTQKVHKCESLVRLIDENGTVLSPYFFLDISKKGKYYAQITQIVLKNSFEALDKIDKDISINLSALDIELKSTQEYIFALLEQYKSKSSRVVFELLEDERIKNFDTIIEFIKKAKSYGVKIAIDDFGAGYSNFERLLDYQPDILKIDGSLIKNILNNNYSLSIVKTIVAFAKEQNIQTVAEFVEDEDTFILLKNLGVDYTQGYYFGKPRELEGRN